MDVYCTHHEACDDQTAGEVINAIENAIRHGIPKTAVVTIEDGTLHFSWVEIRDH